MKKILLFAFLCSALGSIAQTSLNNYKVVLVPAKFEFLKDADQYSINSLTKTLLEQKGFTVYIDGSDVPAAIATDKCQALKADVTLRKSFLATNLTLTLKDCQGNTIYQGKEGRSREKEWALAYQEALREAFKSLDTTQYAYNGNTPTRPQPVAPAPATAVTPQPTTPVSAAVPVASTSDAGTLYAQATATGYQLIDTKPAKVMTLYKTSAPETFLAEKGAKHGIVFKKGADWVFEYYQDGTLLAEQLVIKF